MEFREILLEFGEKLNNFKLQLDSLTMEEVKGFAEEKIENLTDFILDMNFELAHDFIFMQPHYPIFFIVQALFTCVLIKKTQPKMNWIHSFVIGYSLCMFGRNLVGLISGSEIPTLQRPAYTFSYTLIWFLINKFPYDLIFKILKTFVFYVPMQIMMAITAVRESTHGVDVGYRVFPTSDAGALATSFVLCCSESLIWCKFFPAAREFSPAVVLRNMLNAAVYIVMTQYAEDLFPFSVKREEVKIYACLVFVAITLINDLFFGLNGQKSFGKGITKVFSFLPYHGDDFV